MKIKIPSSDRVQEIRVETPTEVISHMVWPTKSVDLEVELPAGVTENQVRVTCAGIGNDGKPLGEPSEIHSPVVDADPPSEPESEPESDPESEPTTASVDAGKLMTHFSYEAAPGERNEDE